MFELQKQNGETSNGDKSELINDSGSSSQKNNSDKVSLYLISAD